MTKAEIIRDERTVKVGRVRVETVQMGLAGQTSYERAEPINENAGD
ncbi:hypothetical protein [Halobacillus aidingensis]|uniref:Uncharacterized protein n=1 Tax=Halobacillus aidingensis TaxID=240303 RepID=A0A1H0MFD5_HALAD|nr:hypothetical protein [Halobacillus aidingensis]SDO79087.1 hypothetical protein SAMN05421677_10818 [Halobacillus aidingensis]